MQGLGGTVMFCGDGINDLAALRAADVGYAVGASDASVASSLTTNHRSVAGATCSHSPDWCMTVAADPIVKGLARLLLVAGSAAAYCAPSACSLAQPDKVVSASWVCTRV